MKLRGGPPGLTATNFNFQSRNQGMNHSALGHYGQSSNSDLLNTNVNSQIQRNLENLPNLPNVDK